VPRRFGLAGARPENPAGMSTDAGSAAAPEDAATREVSSERPGLESADPGSADSATSTPGTADRGVEGSVDGDREDGPDAGSAGAGPTDTGGTSAPDPANEGFVSGILRDATVTGLPGETGAPPAEPHAPQAQQQGDEPVGSEPAVGDNPRGAD
jgi:hypothetical protein